MNQTPRRAASRLLLMLALLLGGWAGAAGLRDKRALILTSYGAGRPGVEAVLGGFNSALVGRGLTIDQVFTENLDLERAPNPSYRWSLRDTLLLKYAGVPFDVIYVVEQPALDFLLGDLAGLAPGAPVIFARAALPGPAEGLGHRFVSQLVTYDVAGTIRRALELFPRTRRVLFVSGGTASDRAVLAQADLAMAPWRGRVGWEDTGNLTLEAMLARVAQPPPDTVIVVLPFDRDAAGRTAVQMEVAILVAQRAQAPVFTLWDAVVGRGAVGGNVTDFRLVGQQAGMLAMDLMAGRAVLAQPVTELPSRATPKFDWARIERWNGAPDRLPGDSVFINRPASLWRQNRLTVLAALLFLIGQTLLIAVLLVQRRQRRRALVALGESEARFRILVEQAPEAIVVYDPLLRRVLDANANAERLFGCGRERLRAAGLLPFYAPDQPDGLSPGESVVRIREQVLATGGALFERAVLRSDGSRLLCEVRLVKLPSAQHPLFRASFIDLTERRRLEAERRELEAQLQQSQKLESLGSLAGGVAHDINNVLAAILSLASAHRQDRDPAEPLARALDTIVSACVRGRDVVRRLLVFARRTVAATGPVDLNGVAREMVLLLESTTLKRIRFVTEFQDGLPALEGDESALAHALMNVCVNAVDAMPDGGVLTVTTRTGAGGELQLNVRDTGHGMTAEVLERAAEPFFTTKPKGQGTGLGLAMVFGTVRSHRGSLAIRSDPGQGTEVTLSFPAPGV